MMRIGVLLVCALALFAFADAARAQGPANARVALVVGSAAYPEGQLAEPQNDARAMADALREAGFDVAVEINPTRDALIRAITNLARRQGRDGATVFYYSGHAVQVARQNFLQPVDARIGADPDFRSQGIALQGVLEQLAAVPARMRLVIVEAARRNPSERRTRGFSAGLASVDPGEDTLVALSIEPGKVGPEREETESLYTRELAQRLAQPTLPIREAFEQAREAVARASGRSQVPWESPSIRSPVFAGVLRAPAPSAPQPQSAAPTARDNSAAFELAFWESIRTSTNPADYRAYLRAYPDGRFAALARIRAGSDDPVSAPVSSPPAVPSIPTPAPAPPAVIPPVPAPQAPRGPTTASAERVAPVANPRPGEVFRDCAGCPEMVAIAPGAFEMGSDEATFERPRRRVQIGAPFAIGRNEVTFAEWDRCVDAGGCRYRPDDRGWGRETRPVINVSWLDAREYVAWLAQTTGQSYRLPTEAEWEFAARGGTTTTYWWGRSAGAGNANCSDCEPGEYRGRSAPVGSFAANKLGLTDTAGNVAEWVEDCWSENFRGAPSDGSAREREDCRERVLRGGSFANNSKFVRSAFRYKYDVDVRYYGNGFRVARSLR